MIKRFGLSVPRMLALLAVTYAGPYAAAAAWTLLVEGRPATAPAGKR
jgi:hypothetical protein